jgi:PKD domain
MTLRPIAAVIGAVVLTVGLAGAVGFLPLPGVVLPPPTLQVAFTYTASGLTLQVVSHVTASSGAFARTTWSWGDGTSSATNAVPENHTYGTAGHYTVTLTAAATFYNYGGKNALVNATTSQVVNISAGSTVTGNTTTGCVALNASSCPSATGGFSLTLITGLLIGAGIGLIVLAAIWGATGVVAAVILPITGAILGFVLTYWRPA